MQLARLLDWHVPYVPDPVWEAAAGPARQHTPVSARCRREQHQSIQGASWPPRLAFASCWRPASTSATRRAAGTRRCAASSSASATASTSSTCCKTEALLAAGAASSPPTLAHRGGTVLFVGTKKQARDAIKEVAEAAGMPYVNHRWLGGLLTNFQTISSASSACTTSSATRPRASSRAADARADGRAGRPREAAGEPRRRQEHAARARTRCS